MEEMGLFDQEAIDEGVPEEEERREIFELLDREYGDTGLPCCDGFELPEPSPDISAVCPEIAPYCDGQAMATRGGISGGAPKDSPYFPDTSNAGCGAEVLERIIQEHLIAGPVVTEHSIVEHPLNAGVVIEAPIEMASRSLPLDVEGTFADGFELGYPTAWSALSP